MATCYVLCEHVGKLTAIEIDYHLEKSICDLLACIFFKESAGLGLPSQISTTGAWPQPRRGAA
jgi:hypothetical protein